MPVHDDLGTRMKEYYESVPKIKLVRRMPVAIRIDVDDDCDQATLDSMIYAAAEDLVWDTASYSWEKVEE